MARNGKKNWSQQDIEYLCQRWGEISIPSIAKALGRSENAVILKAHREGLGAVLSSSEAISLSQLVIAIRGNNSGYSTCYNTWVKKHGLPIHTKRINKNSFRVVYIDEFWEWAEKHRSIIDFSRMEPLMLGVEPEWVDKQRRIDFRTAERQKQTPWTKAEDDRLKYLVAQQKYGYAEVSKMINRSIGAIIKRLVDLGIKARPLRAESSTRWTEEQFTILTDAIKAGESYYFVADKIGKSEKAVRGRAYYDYLTEDVDQIRNMIGDGVWGDNMPIPTVKQAKCLSRCKRECKNIIQSLTDVLQKRAYTLKEE